MSYLNCKIKKVYYNSTYNNKPIKITIYGNYRKYQTNNGNGNGNLESGEGINRGLIAPFFYIFN